MKKSFLLLAIMFLAIGSANAVDWRPIDTNIPNFSMYIDKDSINNVNSNECVYAIRYQIAEKPEQVAYLKSDAKKNYIGVINSGNFEENNYKPKVIFYNAHVFMKPVNGDSFLNFAHHYAINILADRTIAEAKKNAFTPDSFAASQIDNNTINVSYETKLTPQRVTNATNLKEYVEETANLINENWTPPKSGRNTQAILIVQIGTDGSLLNYKFAKPSGDATMEHSIIAAVEKTVPYAGYAKLVDNTDSLNFQFVFDYKWFQKSVK